MSPTHHPSEDLLMEYASGSTPEAVALLVATHLALCPICRARDTELEDLGGELLDALEPAPMGVSVDALLTRLGEPEPVPPLPGPLPAGGAPDDAVPDDAVLPQPLRGYVGPLSALRWRTLLPGIQQLELPLSLDGVPVRLARLRGGVVIPAHAHSADELSLVLTGGFQDERGHYLRGDVSTCTPADIHTQRIDRGERCITLAVNRGRMLPVDWKGRLVEKLTGGF